MISLPSARAWRTKIFVATWCSYVGFYFCRKHWNAAKAAIEAQNGWSVATTAGYIGSAYLVAYAIGQFAAAPIGARFGPRRTVLAGMAVSIAVTCAMTGSASPWLFGGLMTLLGFAQATGWSGNVGIMANWFHKRERGRVMGLWSTNFTIGSIATGLIFALVLGDAAPLAQPWRRCFWLGAAILALVWVQFFVLQRDRPEDVGFTSSDGGIEPKVPPIDASTSPMQIALTRDQWINILLVGSFYFCAKLIRYAVWSWAAYFLQNKFHESGSTANMYSIAFEVCGVPGVIVTGWLSDRFFAAKRATVALIMMLGMIAATASLLAWGDTSAGVFAALLGVVGFFLFGPDALLSGAGAMDIGSRKIAMRATAIIAGFGAIGPVVQELVISRSYQAKTAGLGPLFAILFVASALGALACAALVWRNRHGGRGI
jgi:OPA family sugar phosphate sensor protein UhpC-like MFS transporter